MSRKFAVSSYKSRFDRDKKLSVKQVSWDAVAKRLLKSVETSETEAEYHAMESLEKLAIKDVGWFVGGEFDPPVRKKDNLKSRSLLTLDVDHLQSWEGVEVIEEAYRNLNYMYHSSHSHTEDEPRLRIVIPLSRDVTPEEYEPVARIVAAWMGMDYFDDTTYQFSRIMFWPSRPKGSEPVVHVNKGSIGYLDPGPLLHSLGDWHDWETWPRSSRETGDALRPPVAKSADPFTKPGVIGAFNRAFPIDVAIEKFELPYFPSGEGNGRYTYAAGTSADGAIFYEDGHLYSNHETDPAGQQNCNAWDLVRIHKWGHLDTDSNEPIGQRPSQTNMQATAMEQPEVVAELVSDDFEDLGPLEVDGKLVERKEINYESIHEAIQAAHNDERAAHKVTGELINLLAAARLVEHEEETLVNHLQEFNKLRGEKLTKVGLLKAIKTQRKALTGKTTSDDGDLQDIEKAMITHIMDEHFEKGKVIRCIDNVFWLFNRGRWAPEDNNRILHKIDQSIFDLRETRPKDYKNLVTAIGERMTSAISGSLKNLFAHEVASLHDSDDPLKLRRRFGHPVMNCNNGELHFHRSSGEFDFKPHNPDSFLDVRLNVDYDPEAPCPEWDRFCGLLFRESPEPEEMQRHLEELLGYILQFSRWMKHFAIFMGYTDAGKSTIVDLLKTFLDGSYVEAPITMFAEEKRNQFTNGMLMHSLLLVDEERSKTGLLPDAALKSLAEEKPITTEIKHGGKMNFVSRVFPLIVSNQWPRSTDIGEAFTRRALVWHFKHEIPPEERSDRRRDKMLKELPGILNRLVAGITRLRKRGKFSVPVECRAAKHEWISHCNPVARFVDHCLVKQPGLAEYKCRTSSEVYSHYKEFASVVEQVPVRFQVKPEEFWLRMTALGHNRGANRVRGYTRVAGISGLVDLEESEDTSDF